MLNSIVIKFSQKKTSNRKFGAIIERGFWDVWRNNRNIFKYRYRHPSLIDVVCGKYVDVDQEK